MKYVDGKLNPSLPYIAIAGAGFLRLESSHIYNFVPVFSCLLLFAAVRPLKEWGLALLTLIGVDIFLTTHQYDLPLTIDSVVTWTWYLVAMLAGSSLLRSVLSWRRAVVCSILASTSYFFVSNYMVWAGWNMYPRTLAGLWTCYSAGLPFFRNSVVSELLCSVLLFGLCSEIIQLSRVRTAANTRC